MQFNGLDCNNNSVDLFADLDAGKAVVLFFYMPSCGTCPPPAQKIQAMTNKINSMYPGMVKGYAFPYQNSTTCSYSSSWVSSNNLGMLYTPMDSGAAHVANYGGFGMPTIVLLGGSGNNRRVMFSTLNFKTTDTTVMRDSIYSLITAGIQNLPDLSKRFLVFPNPASESFSLEFQLKEPSDIQIEIIDLLGKKVLTLQEEGLNGKTIKQIQTSALPNGNYFVRLKTDYSTLTQKITIHH